MASRVAARARGCCSLPIPLHSKWGEHGINSGARAAPHPNPLPASGERERQVARAQFNSIAATAALTKVIHTNKVMAAMRGGHPGQTENCLEALNSRGEPGHGLQTSSLKPKALYAATACLATSTQPLIFSMSGGRPSRSTRLPSDVVTNFSTFAESATGSASATACAVR